MVVGENTRLFSMVVLPIIRAVMAGGFGSLLPVSKGEAMV